MKTFGKSLLSSLGLAALLAAPAAHAGDIGGSLFTTGGEVIFRFEGSDASYNSLISVNGSSEIFANHGTAPGTEFSLGSFAAGTALDVVLHVLTTGLSFHTGTGSLNPDNMPHASISVEGNRTFVSFEDMVGGGDRDFNDYTLSFTNVVLSPAPEPSVYAMLAAGLGVLGFVGRRRRKL